MTFKPSFPATILMAAIMAGGSMLGTWQLRRADVKQSLIDQFAAAPRLEILPSADSPQRFSRISVYGEFLQDRDVLIDNRVLEGRPGVLVVSPFRTQAGTHLLVNRGWLPMPPDRRSLPKVPAHPSPMEISGILDRLTIPGRKLGPADQLNTTDWPQLVTYPELPNIESALGIPLYPLVLLLDRDSPGGFAGRDWSPVFMTPERHQAYAFQWFALAVTALVAWLALAVHRGRRNSGSTAT